MGQACTQVCRASDGDARAANPPCFDVSFVFEKDRQDESKDWSQDVTDLIFAFQSSEVAKRALPATLYSVPKTCEHIRVTIPERGVAGNYRVDEALSGADDYDYFYVTLNLALRGCDLSRDDLGALNTRGVVYLSKLDLSGSTVESLELLQVKTLRSLSLARTSTRNIKQLARCERLEDLDLSHCPVAGVESMGPKGLQKLVSLNLSDCTFVSDLSSLVSCPHLDHLAIGGTSVASVAPLVRLKSLKSLIYDRSIGSVDLKAIGSLTSLTELNLNGSFTSQPGPDLTPLMTLGALEALSLAHTSVENIGPLSECFELTTLDLADTPVSNIDILAGLEHLEFLSLAGTQICSLDPLSWNKKLRSLSFYGTQVKDLGPLAGLEHLSALNGSDTLVESIGPLASCRSLVHLDLRNTKVSEVADLSGCRNLRTLLLTGCPVEISALSAAAAVPREASVVTE